VRISRWMSSVPARFARPPQQSLRRVGGVPQVGSRNSGSRSLALSAWQPFLRRKIPSWKKLETELAEGLRARAERTSTRAMRLPKRVTEAKLKTAAFTNQTSISSRHVKEGTRWVSPRPAAHHRSISDTNTKSSPRCLHEKCAHGVRFDLCPQRGSLLDIPIYARLRLTRKPKAAPFAVKLTVSIIDHDRDIALKENLRERQNERCGGVCPSYKRRTQPLKLTTHRTGQLQFALPSTLECSVLPCFLPTFLPIWRRIMEADQWWLRGRLVGGSVGGSSGKF